MGALADGVETFVTAVQHLEGVGLRNDGVEIVVLPQAGAKVFSLRNRRSGREWMWRPPGGSRFAPVNIDTPFAASSVTGADECLPTIAPCRWRGDALPDHGEVWSMRWLLDHEEFERGRIHTRVELPISPFDLERTISLDGSAVHFAYRLYNRSEETREFVWAFHPLLQFDVGDRIVFADQEVTVRTDTSVNCALGERGDGWAWPVPIVGIQLDQLDLGGDEDSGDEDRGDEQGSVEVARRALKVFTDPLSVGQVAIRNEDEQDGLAFAFSTDEIDTVGIWINRGGWNNFHHIAIEPGIGAPDPLDLAVEEWRRFGVVGPRETRSWSFQITVGLSAG